MKVTQGGFRFLCDASFRKSKREPKANTDHVLLGSIPKQ